MYLLASFYAALIVCSNNCLATSERVYSMRDEVLSCSSWLSTIIFNICNNTYKIIKRDTSAMLERLAPEGLQKATHERRLVDARVWRRVRRQVANECCLRPCTVADIIMYCPEDAKLLVEHPDIFD